MKGDRSSETARGASVIRSVHQLIDDPPLILHDPVSPMLLSGEAVEAIKRDPAHHQTPQAKGLRSHVVLRSRYAEDLLREAAESGVSQYVSIGAGFDTFSFRQPEWAKGLRIVEVDHPASQRAKLKHFQNRGFLLPSNTTFAPLDLEKGSLAENLGSTQLNLEEPAFFSCLGVLAYLNVRAVVKMLKGVARMPRGSSLVLTFAPKDRDGSARQSEAAERAEQHREPWRTYFTIEELHALLKECGFSAASFLSPDAAAERYYEGRKDLPAPRKTRLCLAKV